MFSRIVTDDSTEYRIRRSIRAAGSKNGSYIVEAAITLPVFLIAVMVMSSVILMYACIENCSFTAAGELRRSSAEAVYADTSVMLPYRLKKEIKENNSQIDSARVTDFGYRVSRWGQDELIALKVNMSLRTSNPLGIKARADYDLALVTRAYVGKIRDNPAMSADEMSGASAEPVYIFPKRGEKYHSAGCGFLTAASTSGVLTRSIKAKYKPCPLCGSGKAPSGARIYYFPSAGEDYHLSGCSALQRNYVEIDKRDALERGYTPCSKCGG
jgi:hypothetical protein